MAVSISTYSARDEPGGKHTSIHYIAISCTVSADMTVKLAKGYCNRTYLKYRYIESNSGISCLFVMYVIIDAHRRHTRLHRATIKRLKLFILNVEKCRDLEIGERGHSRSLKVVPFDRLCKVSYWCSIVTISLKCAFFAIFDFKMPCS